MKRPGFVSDNDVIRWSKELDNDPMIPSELIEQPILKEVCFAGMWLSEKLSELGCPNEMITRIQFGAGKNSYGKDIWVSHKKALDDYNNGVLTVDIEHQNIN